MVINKFSIKEKRLEKFELKIKSIALNILHIPYNTEKKDMHTSQNIIQSVKIK